MPIPCYRLLLEYAWRLALILDYDYFLLTFVSLLPVWHEPSFWREIVSVTPIRPCACAQAFLFSLAEGAMVTYTQGDRIRTLPLTMVAGAVLLLLRGLAACSLLSTLSRLH